MPQLKKGKKIKTTPEVSKYNIQLKETIKNI